MAAQQHSNTNPYHVKRIVDASESEIGHLTAILVDAFEGDPFRSIILGGDLSLAHLEARANICAALIGGEVHVLDLRPTTSIEHENSEESFRANVVGVAIWYPPGKRTFATYVCLFLFSTYNSAHLETVGISEEERAAGWNQFLASIPPSLHAWWTDYFIPTMAALSSNALGPAYLLNAWHLHLFGVLKAHQGRGYGRALFAFAADQAAQNAAPMVVETTTVLDVQIYTKFGFTVCAETDIESSVAKAHVWLMHKE